MTPEDFRNQQWQKISKPAETRRRRKTDFKKFWLLWMPAGALAGFIACNFYDSGGVFFPVWGVTTLGLWSLFGEEK